MYKSVNDYDIVKQIGSGSFGVVYLVKSKEINSSKSECLVLKQISLTKLDARQRSDAQKEILLLSTLKHPNIVSYRHSFENDLQQLHIVMDYCDGGDLYRKIIERKRIGVPFDERQLAQWFVQICLALKYIHERKILHRDLKTQNIFACDGDKTVKVGDFGIAKILDHTADLAATCIGTPYYLSPEVCQNKPYGTKTDVWALGCVLYELATFRHPFEGRHLTELLTKIVRGLYEPLPVNYSAGFKSVIGHMLKVNSNERPDINGLLKRDYVYVQTAEFLHKTGRFDELATLESSLQHRRNAREDQKQQSSRSLGLVANPIRRHAPMGTGRSNTSATRKVHLEKKFRMYMIPPAAIRPSSRGQQYKVGTSRPKQTLTPIAEGQVIPTDPAHNETDISKESLQTEVEKTEKDYQASPSSSTNTPQSRGPDSMSPSLNAEETPNLMPKPEENPSVIHVLGSTFTKSKRRERKKWNAVRQTRVTFASSSISANSTCTVGKKNPSQKSVMPSPCENAAATCEMKPTTNPKKNVAGSVPSIPGAIDDGWMQDASLVCGTCGSLYITGRKITGMKRKQCEYCRKVKEMPKTAVVNDNKSIFEKIECLREDLERSLGIGQFTRIYQNAMNAKRLDKLTTERMENIDKKKLETLLFFERAYIN